MTEVYYRVAKAFRCEPVDRISFGGNLQLTNVLLLGKPIDAQRNAIACLVSAVSEDSYWPPAAPCPTRRRRRIWTR